MEGIRRWETGPACCAVNGQRARKCPPSGDGGRPFAEYTTPGVPAAVRRRSRQTGAALQENPVMKASLWLLSAAVAVCVANAAALAQYPGRPDWPGAPGGGLLNGPLGSVPPNWTPGPGGVPGYLPPGLTGPQRPLGLQGAGLPPPGFPGFPGGPVLKGPAFDPNFIGPGGVPGSFSPPAGIIPEPTVRAFLEKDNPPAPRPGDGPVAEYGQLYSAPGDSTGAARADPQTGAARADPQTGVEDRRLPQARPRPARTLRAALLAALGVGGGPRRPEPTGSAAARLLRAEENGLLNPRAP